MAALQTSWRAHQASVFQGSTLTYFGLPGRGEAVRLALVIIEVEWTDKRLAFPEWKEVTNLIFA